MKFVPPSASNAATLLLPLSVRFPAPTLATVLFAAVMSPLMNQLAFARAATLMFAVGVNGRLIVCVMGSAGTPVKPMSPDRLRLLPLSVNAPAVLLNARLVAVMPTRSLLLFKRTLPPNVRPSGKMGTALPSQLTPVLQKLLAPPPSH